jgi:hypothetical protein
MRRCAPGWCRSGVWSERHGGTNRMGTCLAERAALIVHRDQHFLARNTGSRAARLRSSIRRRARRGARRFG